MNKTITHREPDGSVHYSHCYSEDLRHHPKLIRPVAFRPVQRLRPLRGLRLYQCAVGMVTQSVENFRAIEAMITALEDRRGPGNGDR